MDLSTRLCPTCGSPHLLQTPRGFAGRSDTPHQYLTCQQCGQIVYEILSVTQRDIRLNRYEAGAVVVRDSLTYTVRRILKVGFDEHLLYLKVLAAEPDEPETPAAPASETSDA
ncbi:MAG: zinc ribbon domain-containing protein [Chloroflexi bacterium]|nr:zinc ribbon domain-containing protein [Chloroflexota bacterium]